MNLLDSLLDAIVRLDGDALVMHVGEKPYVVTTSEAMNQFRGPLAWGQVELSTRVLTLDAVSGMLGQILPLDQRVSLDEYGATEYEVQAASHPDERFTIVAARGGDDIWIEMRRQPTLSADAAAAIAGLRDDGAAAAAEDLPAIAAEEPQTVEPQAVETRAAESPAVADSPAAAADPPPPVEAAAAPEPEPVAQAADGSHDVAADLPEVEIRLPVVTLDQPEHLDEEPLEVVTVHSSVHDVSAPTEAVPEPQPVFPTATHDMASEDEPSHPDQTDDDVEEPYAIDLDTDRDLAEELLTIDGDFDNGLLGAGQEWNDDVMTEGELGELLRATAAAVIAGEINHDEPAPVAAAADTVEPVPPSLAEPTAVDEKPSTPDHRVARATEELPALVEYQRQRDRAASGPPPDVPGVSDAEVLSVHEIEVVAAQEPPAGVLLGEPVFETAGGEVLGSEPPATATVAEPGADAAASAEESPEEEVAPPRPAAVVLPLTRQAKTESGADPRANVATTLQRLLRLAASRGAATVYVVGHSAPLVRIDGEFSTLEGEPAVSAAFVERLLAEVAPSTRGASPSAEWLIDVAEIGRVRCVAFRDHRGPGVIFRMVPARAIAADQIGLAAEVQALASEADGLVLVTGSRGSGKSTLLNSFIDLINRNRSDHVITAESQIDFVHEAKRSFISQREVRGEDALLSTVRAASREEPDVLVIEDVRTTELATLALDAAESGRLVFISVPGLSAASAIERLIELFPAERREKVQASLASTLRGVVSQVLLRKLRGGRVAAREVLINTPQVASLIAEGKTFQLPAAVENGRAAGMASFAESLASLVREGIVHPAHAYRKAPNRDQFLAALRRNGVDTAIAERLG